MAVLGLLLIAACGNTPPAGDPVNAEDVMFVQMMVQHHRQGVEIAGVAAGRATTQEVRTLAAIESTQQDEVEMMLRWLHEWGLLVDGREGSARPPRRDARDRPQADRRAAEVEELRA